MGRIRTIKPDFFLDEDLAQHKPLTRLIFIGLWTLADCEGRLEDRPLKIKAQLAPYENLDMEATLTALAGTGNIVRYRAGGKAYIEVVNFLKHQRLSGKEAQATSKFPSPDEFLAALEAGADPGSDGERQGSDGEAADAQEGKGKEGKRKGNGKSRVVNLSPIKTPEAQEAFDRIHASWPTKRPVDGKAAKGDRLPAERAFQTILDSQEATIAELEDAARLYLGYHPRVKEGYVVFISTFFGPEKGLWAEAVRTIRARREKAAGEGL